MSNRSSSLDSPSEGRVHFRTQNSEIYLMSGGSLKVKLFDSNGTQVIPVAKTNLTVGSAKHCDVVLDHPSVQAEHLRAWFDAGRIWVQDMGTQSGTFLNGIRLPSLKPMLIRELDVLKLGDNPATLGMEANLVRAPVVRPQTPVEEATQPGVKAQAAAAKDAELEKKRDELAKIRRELAELKLQLQMGRLDKESEDEAHRHLSVVRNEMQNLQDQRAKLERTLKQMESLRQTQIDAVEKEINERKAQSMTQLKSLMDHEMSKLADWKMQVMGEIRRDIHAISETKARLWVTRPLSKDMILEWEADIQALLRKVLLGEKADAAIPDSEEETQIKSTAVVQSSPPPVADPRTGKDRRNRERDKDRDRRDDSSFRLSSGTLPGRSQVTHTEVSRSQSASLNRTPVPRIARRVQQLSKGGESWKMILLVVLIGGLIAAAVLFKKGILPLPKERGVAGVTETVGSSTRTPNSPVKKKYEPVQTKGFRKTYTDNILFTPEFLDLESSTPYRQQWLSEFNKVATSEWKLEANTAKIVMEREGSLITDLKRLRESIDGGSEQPGIQAMREREAAFQMELNTLLKGKPLTEKFVKLKKTFFTRLQLGLKASPAKK